MVLIQSLVHSSLEFYEHLRSAGLDWSVGIRL
jgi:hypothetical protein